MNTSNRISTVSGKNILCLAVDRLNADFLGAYGNAWIETPAFDALAAESVLFDSFFATSLDLETLYRAFWRGESPARVLASLDDESANETSDEPNVASNGANSGDFNAADAAPPSIFRLLKEKGYRTFVVSDDETVALHPAVEDEYCDGRFFLGSPDAALPAETLEETRFFRNFEELARFLAKLEDDAKCAKDENGGDAAPWFVWAHFSGWNERWDFPLELRERFQEDEDDPEPYSATLVPYWPLEESAKSAKRGARVNENAVVEAALARAAAILDADAENDASDAADLPAEVEIEFNVEFDDPETPDDADFNENNDDPEFNNADFNENNDDSEFNDVDFAENADDSEFGDADAFLDESAVERQLAATELARLAQLDAPERRQAVVEGYCGGVAAFDETLEGFVQLLKESGVLAKTLLLTTATRGFPTGSPSALGVEPTSETAAADVFAPTPSSNAPSDAIPVDDVDSPNLPISASYLDDANAANAPLYATGADGETSRFYAESFQLPLAIRLPNGVGATVRLPALCEPRDVFATLRDWPEFAAELATPEFWSFEAIEISPFAGKWSAESETEIAEELDADDVLAVEKERTADFVADAPDVSGQNLLRLLANEDGVLRDRVSVVARDAKSKERALVVADWILKETPLAPGVDVDDFSGTGAFVADAATLTAAPNAVGSPPSSDASSNASTADAPLSSPRLSRFELFVRPDDRYNVNDVANRCVEIVEKLAPALRPARD
ncbi:MAG: sulfatase-like hydrolase/transferase [Thermoguttaceae bacterium]|nr:sulfatase-like hydrolase/transferase [Thermoguttaceae bacterium]